MLSAIADELRHALRALANNPGFSALVIGVLASGLACVLFMLVMINGLVLRPLPFAQPERLLHAGVTDGSNYGRLDNVSGRDLLELRRRLADQADVAGYQSATINLSDLDRPERYDGAMISANLARVLGVAPLLGRDLAESDEQPGAPPVVLLSHTLWQSRYGGDPGIVGRQIRVNTRPTTVVGIMPPGLSYPYREVVWIPATLREDVPDPENSYVIALRLRDGVDQAAVATSLEAWRNDAMHADPERLRGVRTGVESLAMYTINLETRIVLGIMLAAVVLVLLVACANAANLLLLRTLSRRQELAVRVALGASRSRIALHLLAQSLLLALIATAIALPLATLAMRHEGQLLRSSPNGVAEWLSFELDWNLVAMAVGAALLTALATGLLPALRAARDTVAGTLRDGSRGNAGGAFVRLSRALVIGEVALSCALLIVVGTMIRGIVTLDRIDLGFDASHLLSARIGLFTNTYPTGADQVRLFEKLTERLRGDAQVGEASVATTLPLRFGSNRDLLPEGVAAEGDNALPKARYGAVDDHFLATYGLRLLRGRFFDQRDASGGERVAVVDPVFAQHYADGGDVVGRRFRLDPRSADGPTVTIVGVIAPLKLDAPGEVAPPRHAGAAAPGSGALRQSRRAGARRAERVRAAPQRDHARGRCGHAAVLGARFPRGNRRSNVRRARRRADVRRVRRDCAGARRCRPVRHHGVQRRPAHARDRRAPRTRCAGGRRAAQPVRAHRLAVGIGPRRRPADRHTAGARSDRHAAQHRCERCDDSAGGVGNPDRRRGICRHRAGAARAEHRPDRSPAL
jgi:predicted permease